MKYLTIKKFNKKIFDVIFCKIPQIECMTKQEKQETNIDINLTPFSASLSKNS